MLFIAFILPVFGWLLLPQVFFWFWMVRTLYRSCYRRQRSTVDLSDVKNEVIDLYAWKLFRLKRSSFSRRYKLVGLVRDSYAYHLFDSNCYDPSCLTGIGYKGIAQIGYDYRIQGPGFYSFKHPYMAWTSHVRYCVDLPRGQQELIVAKVRIYGTVIEGTRGYKSEYFDIVDFYTLPRHRRLGRRSIEDVLGNLGWAFKVKKMRFGVWPQKDRKIRIKQGSIAQRI